MSSMDQSLRTSTRTVEHSENKQTQSCLFKGTAGYNLMFMTVVHTESYNYWLYSRQFLAENFRNIPYLHTVQIRNASILHMFVKLGYFIHIARDGN